MFNSVTKPFSIFIVLILGVFFIFNSLDFKLDASSDTLILQNDKDFKYFNYYNDIFPSKNFLVLAIKSDNKIDDIYLTKINEIKSILSNIKNIDSTFSIVDAPILISNNLKLADLSATKIPTINDNIIDLESVLNEFADSPIFQDQLISQDKKVSSIIIYIKKNNKFLEIKKKREDIINKNANENYFKEINNKYKLEKEKYNEENNNSLYAKLYIDTSKIPKIRIAELFYQQSYSAKPFSFKSDENTLFGYNIGIEMADNMVLLLRGRKSYVLDGENYRPVKTTQVETQIIF